MMPGQLSYMTQPAAPAALAHAMPMGRILRAYAMESRYDVINGLRTIGASVPFIVLPFAVYLLFGVIMFTPAAEADASPQLADYLFCGFASFGALMPGIFLGVNLAIERENRLLELRRALPAPGGAGVVAKIVTTMVFSAIAVALVVVTALIAGRITLSPAAVLVVWAIMIAGSIPFCAIGLFIGSIASASAAPAWGNLLFLPMIWLSGMFIPLPEFLEPYVVIWPAFHLNQVALSLAGVGDFVFLPVSLAVGVLLGMTVLFGGLAVYRLARVG